MKYIFGVRDRKANCVNSLSLFENDAVARRMFEDAVNHVEMLRQWPQDFELLCFGEFDERGIVTAVYDFPKSICFGDDFKTSKEVE